MRRHPWLVLAFVAIAAVDVFLCASCRVAPQRAPLPRLEDALGEPPLICIEIVKAAPSVELECEATSDVEIHGSQMDAFGALSSFGQQNRLSVQPAAHGMVIGGRPYEADRIYVDPAGDGVSMNGRLYRGDIRIKRTSASALAVVNVIDPEALLYSVVSAEMPSRWPMDALKAQAVAARTFVLYRWANRRRRRVHVTRADVRYLGMSSETSRSRRAVDETRGAVLAFRGQLLPAYFSSTCGGRTCPVDRAFGEPRIAPLAGVECGHCEAASFYSWRCRIEKAGLAQRLGLASDQTVTAMRPDAARPFERAAQVVVETDSGAMRIDSYRFRTALGPDRLKSSAFVATDSGSAFDVVGRGWGHGVGLCQWGARGLARAGSDWRAISSHYYPEARLAQIY